MARQNHPRQIFTVAREPRLNCSACIRSFNWTSFRGSSVGGYLRELVRRFFVEGYFFREDDFGNIESLNLFKLRYDFDFYEWKINMKIDTLW